MIFSYRVVAAAALLLPAGFGQNLVRNGSFEEPVFVEPFNTSPVPGWTVRGEASAEIQRNAEGVRAWDGNQWLELDVASNTSIYQDLATVRNQRYRISFAVANRPGSRSSTVRVLWGGALAGIVTRTQTIFDLASFEVTATAPVMRLQFDASGPSDSVGDMLDAVSVVPIGSVAISSAYYLGQFADGDGWTTAITFSNPTGGEVAGGFAVYGDDGRDLDTARLRSALSLGPYRTATFESPGVGAARVGWVRVDASAEISVSAVFRQRAPGRPDFEAAVPARVPSTRVWGPFDNEAGFSTGLALVNPGNNRLLLSLSFRDAQGVGLLTTTVILNAQNHTSFSLPDRFPDLAGRQGSVEIVGRTDAGTPAEFVALGLRFNPGGAFTTLPY